MNRLDTETGMRHADQLRKALHRSWEGKRRFAAIALIVALRRMK